jgi:hypothetical protein
MHAIGLVYGTGRTLSAVWERGHVGLVWFMDVFDLVLMERVI